jgi:hypothetical protein
MSEREFRILSPTAILGYGFPESSFEEGLARGADLIAVDAGSTDPGPFYLGSGKSFTDRQCVKRDLRLMLTAGVKRGIPVVIGSAGGSGAAPHLAWCRDIIEEIAREESLAFRLGVIAADIDPADVHAALDAGEITPLAYAPEATHESIDASTYIVAQMGVEPIQRALEEGCDVVLTGRCYDPAAFAALPILRGFDAALSLHCGKILECAAIAATPGSGRDCAMGLIRENSFVLEPLSAERKFTRSSAAAHTLYEKTDPYHLPGPGGALNLEDCTFTELDGGRCEVSGTRFEPTDPYFIKLEAARVVGYRTISIAGLRDPIMIGQIDSILDEVRRQVSDTLSRENVCGEIVTKLYGRDGVMGSLEPTPVSGHELGLVIEAISPTQDEADTLCAAFRSTLLHYGYPGRMATAGNLALPYSPSDVPAGAVYEFSLYHLMPCADPAGFPREIIEIGGAS